VDVARNPLRALPSVDRLLTHAAMAPLLAQFNRALVTRHCRDVLADVRASIRGGADPPDDHDLLARVAERLRAAPAAQLQRVVNATGTVLHTNLGRAPLARAAIDALVAAAAGPVNLDMRSHWSADVGFLSRLPKSMLMQIAADAPSIAAKTPKRRELQLKAWAKMKRDDLAKAVAKALEGAGWLPDLLITPVPAGALVVTDEGQAAAASIAAE
jgi:L-seryl-tRNA(Ser) seleniumtransferase